MKLDEILRYWRHILNSGPNTPTLNLIQETVLELEQRQRDLEIDSRIQTIVRVDRNAAGEYRVVVIDPKDPENFNVLAYDLTEENAKEYARIVLTFRHHNTVETLTENDLTPTMIEESIQAWKRRTEQAQQRDSIIRASRQQEMQEIHDTPKKKTFLN